MKRKILQLLVPSIIILSLFTQCQYYSFRKSVKPNFNILFNEGESSQHYIVHSDSVMMELKNVVVDLDRDRITGTLDEFDGLSLHYYNKIRTNANGERLQIRKKKTDDILAVDQTHIFISDTNLTFNDSISIAFEEIFKTEVLRNAIVRNRKGKGGDIKLIFMLSSSKSFSN